MFLCLVIPARLVTLIHLNSIIKRDITALNYINFNASRNSNLRKIEGFLNFLKEYDPIIVTIQEINIRSSLKIFSDTFQVIINTEPESRDGIGIVTLIKKGSEY